MSGVGQAVFMNQRSFGPPPGQQAFTTAGTFTWVAPAGVTTASAVAIGGGALRGGGGLGYKNNITVSPGTSYTVVVGSAGGTSSFINTCTLRGGGGCSSFGGTFTGDGGGNGGGSGNYGGGGAGGYSGNGGQGASIGNAAPGSGGGGGGGGGRQNVNPLSGSITNYGGGGGGTGILGEGSNGTAGTGGTGGGCATGGGGGSGGSNGTTGTSYSSPGNGGLHGGAGALADQCTCGVYCQKSGAGARGAVRIIWPGCARSFPSTRTADE